MAEEPPKLIGLLIRTIRKDKGLTLVKLAELTGMKFAMIQRLETSPTANPQLTTLQRLAGALGVTVAELVKDVPVIEPEKK